MFLIIQKLSAQVPPGLKRVCRQNTDNTLFFDPSTDTCSRFKSYYIWARKAASDPFLLIDSVANKASTQYLHVNANPVGVPSPWTYFIQYNDSCNTDSGFSDTITVDLIPPDTVYIDSVSIDIVTNRAQIGWRFNRSPDFHYFILYTFVLQFNNGTQEYDTVYTPVRNNYRDTFAVDTSALSNPQLATLNYDITSVDSCGNPVLFGFNPHSTILLKSSVDTCREEATLSWTHYKGWNKIRSYHIYKSINSGAFLLVDSLDGSINTYKDPIVLGQNIEYFVRAYKLSDTVVSSTSCLTRFSTRLRTEPASTYLASVSAPDPDGSYFDLKVLLSSGEEVKSIVPVVSVEPALTIFFDQSPVSTINQTGLVSSTLPIISSRNVIHHIKVNSLNLCDQVLHTSNVSPIIIVKGVANGGENILSWNKYFGWDTEVEKYRIYRGTDVDGSAKTYELIDSVPGSDSTYTDTRLPERIGSFGLCYYVEAVQLPGSVHGTTSVARSFSSCILGDLLVFIPTAFVPGGVNNVFRPEGSYIDYLNSSLEIFDRWGGQIVALKGILNGWDGKDASGRLCPQGVYYYKTIINSTNGQQQIKSGFVTLLD